MSDRLQQQGEAVLTTLGVLANNSLCLCTDEMDLIQPTTEAFRPFKEATRETSGAEHVSMSKGIPLVSRLLRAAAATGCESNTFSRELLHQCQ